MTPKTIAIIGGRGKMGCMFKELFEKEGYDVLVADNSTQLTPQEAASKAEVVVVSVPINVTQEVIAQIGPHVRKDALLTDLTSIKSKPVEWMLEYSQAEVIGGHPVFGPGAGVDGQNYVLCPARGETHLSWFEGLLKKWGLNVLTMTADEHDKEMGVIQCLVHLSNFTLASAIKELNYDIQRGEQLASPIYKLRLYILGRVFNQQSQLYTDIEINNPYSKEMAQTYSKVLEDYKSAIDADDAQAFKSLLDEAAQYFASITQKSQEVTNKLIKEMKE